MVNNQCILVLVGASGSGKTTVSNRLSEYGIQRLVTTTTRPKRPGEEDGVDYYFVKETDLDQIDFVERTVYNGYHYGLTVDEIERGLAKGEPIQLAMDRNGARALKEYFPDQTLVVFFYISEEEMICRMKERGDSEEAIQERVDHRKEANEQAQPDETDLAIENNDLDQTVQDILDFIAFPQNK